KKENSKTDNIYREKINEIKIAVSEIEKKEIKPFDDYLLKLSKKILEAAEIESKVCPAYFLKSHFEDLKKDNETMYSHRLPSNFGTSYEELEFSSKIFGEEKAKLLAFFCNEINKNLNYCFYNKRFAIVSGLKKLVDLYSVSRSGEITAEKIRQIVLSDIAETNIEQMKQFMTEQFDPSYKLCHDIVTGSDLSDVKYLFSYGKYISENEIKMADFLSEYSEKKLEMLADQIVGSYIRSFKGSGKSYQGKPYVLLFGAVGLEALLKHLLKKLEEKKFKALFYDMFSTDINKQMKYDFRFSNSLYLDEEYVDFMISSTEKLMPEFKDIFSEVSGMIHVAKFGESPFKPAIKKVKYELTEEQQELNRRIQAEIMQIREKYLPMSSISFTIIAFPSPEIGGNFKEIFSDIIDINLLQAEKYEMIQKKIIDALDSGNYISVKGTEGNRTDIKIALKRLENPEKQTNFVNCGADMNIPVGEVFTSPVLKGTSGVLHVKEAFLNNLRFVDLELVFEDGYITSYNCANFSSPEENKKYVKENLLFPHETLPMGEFAIGTNTLAYVKAKKHKITHLLPVLIIEKMGPHFAIGDTCFSHQEDMRHFNECDGKEMMAKENERSAIRKEDMKKAYFFKHTDITLPFEEIACIKAVGEASEVCVIKDGRFVLEGTEELNSVFE
ncbi:aminopeptidase, partial [candidate division WOR-3 bacterium]|nr:aminopeptidase [candidate division WOR-3 bacterium]